MMPSSEVWICSSVSFSSMKPNALLSSSVISMEVSGLSLANINASIWGMMFPISIMCTLLCLSLERCGAANDLSKPGRDGSLTRAVIGQAQDLQHFIGVVAGLIHGGHPGAVLGGIGVEDGLIQLGIEDLRHELGDEHFFAGFENKIAFGCAGLLFHLRYREEPLRNEGLRSGVPELAIHDLHHIEFLVREGLYRGLCGGLHVLKIEVKEDVLICIGDLVVILLEMFIALFADAPDGNVAFGGLG